VLLLGLGVLIYRMEFMSGWRYSEELLASIYRATMEEAGWPLMSSGIRFST